MMKCYYCQEEMEKGYYSAINPMSPSGMIAHSFTSEEEMNKKGFKAALLRKSISLKADKEAWLCKNCNKVIKIFEVQ